MIEFEVFIGRPVSELLDTSPLRGWSFDRSVDDDLAERVIHYVFDVNGVELQCDKNENVQVIFLFADEYGGFRGAPLGLSFSSTQEEVRCRFGEPTRSGAGLNDEILGRLGPWDRFTTERGNEVHVQYGVERDSLHKVTIMSAEVAP